MSEEKKQLEHLLKDSAIITGGIVVLNFVAQKGLKMSLGVNVSGTNILKLFVTVVASNYVYDSIKESNALGKAFSKL